MNEPLIKKVIARDPREQRHKSPAEIRRQWAERRAYALVFTFPAVCALGYLVYWGVQALGTGGIPTRAALPASVSWAIGIAVGGMLSWAVWGSWGYSCPRCHRHVGMDWSLGFGLLQEPDPSDPPFTCPHCRARLS